MEDSAVSEFLESMGSDEVSEAKLKEMLIAKGRNHALNRISPELRGRISATEIACSAAHSLVADIKSGNERPDDSADLFELLVGRVKRKTIDRIRREMAKKRGGKRRKVSPVDLAAGETKSPYEVAANEVAARIAELLCETPDQLKQCINLLGILGNYSAKEIRQSLERQEWAKGYKLPSISSIHVWIRAERRRIEKRLKDEFKNPKESDDNF